MKEKPVLAAIVVMLLCFCSSFGNGDERIKKARDCFRRHYSKFLPYSRYPDTLRPSRTIYRHLNEMNDIKKTWQNWLQPIIGYSPEKLSNLPDPSFMSEDDLKLATEYHLWLSGRYRVRCITLNRAAEHQSHSDDRYPPPGICKKAAFIAFKYFENHQNLYKKCYEALGEEAQQNIMKELQFQNYIVSQKQRSHYAEIDAFSSVRSRLERLLQRLLRKKRSMDSNSVSTLYAIRANLKPERMAPNENFIFRNRNVFPVADLSLPPEEASRSDRPFLEVAWLLNRYRSLWFKLRRNEFSKFLRHKKKGLTANFIQRLKDAKKVASELFERYELLSNDYHKVLEEHQPDETLIAKNNQFEFDFMEADQQIDISEDVRLQKLRWRCKRKRTALNRVRNVVSQENDQEDLMGVRSRIQELCTSGVSESQPELYLIVSPPETGETEEEDLFLVDALLDLHSNLGPCANENNQHLHDMIEIESLAPKRLKFTRSEENHSQSCPDLDDIYQSHTEKGISELSRIVENPYLSSKISQAVTV